MMADEILRCDSLEIGYDMPLVSNITFTVAPGAVTLVYGPNGVGKSTLVRTLFGLVDARRGSYRWFLGDERSPSPKTLLRAGVRFLGQGPRGFGALSLARQNQVLNRLYGFSQPELPFAPAGNRAVEALSYGQRRLAALNALKAGRPSCYILDEPLAGLDQSVAQEVTGWIAEEVELGAAFLLVEHRVSSLLPIIDQIVVLKGRRVLYSGPMDQIPIEVKPHFHEVQSKGT